MPLLVGSSERPLTTVGRRDRSVSDCDGRQHPIGGLALQVGEFLKHLIRCRNDAGIRLEAALRDDEIGELL